MNKSVFLILLVLLGRPAVAQTYLQLNIGGHEAKQLMSHTQYENYGFGPGYSAGLSAGMVKGGWQFEAGLEYLTCSASRSSELYFDYQLNPVTGELTGAPTDVRTTERYSHIFLPVKAGYQVVKSGRFSATLFAGLAASYNYSHKIRTTLGDDKWHKSGYIGNSLVKFSAWGGAGAEAAYRIKDRVSIVAVPEAWYMLSSFSGSAPVRQHTLMLGLNAGVRYRL